MVVSHLDAKCTSRIGQPTNSSRGFRELGLVGSPDGIMRDWGLIVRKPVGRS